MKIGVSGASGHLGRAVVSELLQRADGHEVVAITRTPETVSGPAQGRFGDYNRPESLAEAYGGLQSARSLMLNNGLDAATAAFEVGYESATQFNREYSRFFGHLRWEMFDPFFFPQVLRNLNWSIASESRYSRSCCVL